MPIQRPIEVFVASNSIFHLIAIEKKFNEIGNNFSFTWVTGQSNALTLFKETKQEKGKIDLLVIHFCDPKEDAVAIVVDCFLQSLATLPTLFFVSGNGSPDYSEERKRLDDHFRINAQDIVCISDDSEGTDLEEALKKLLPRLIGHPSSR